MSWTAPRTWVYNELVDETDMNTHVRDNLLFLKSTPEIGRATSTAVASTTNGVALTVLTISSLAIPADVGAVYVEVWAALYGHTTLGTTGWSQVRIEEATAGLLRRGGNNGNIDQRFLIGEPAHYAPLYMRTDDLAWAGTSRTITLKIEPSACDSKIVGTTDNPIVMRVMRAY